MKWKNLKPSDAIISYSVEIRSASLPAIMAAASILLSHNINFSFYGGRSELIGGESVTLYSLQMNGKGRGNYYKDLFLGFNVTVTETEIKNSDL